MKPIPEDRLITSPGKYYLDNDICVDAPLSNGVRAGILIAADNVVLDLRGHTLTCHLDQNDGSTFAIFISGAQKVTVLNGKMIGFYYGIHCYETKYLNVRNSYIYDNKYIAIHADVDELVLKDNEIINMDFYAPKIEGDSYAIGINLRAKKSLLSSNKILNRKVIVQDCEAMPEVVGILVTSTSTHCIVDSNIIENRDRFVGSYGVWCADDTVVKVTNNAIINFYYPLMFSEGHVLACDNILNYYKSSEEQSEGSVRT